MTLTPALSLREREKKRAAGATNPFSLWEKVRMRASADAA